MPSSRTEVLNQVKRVELEYGATRFAVDRLLGDIRSDSSWLPEEIKVKNIQIASSRLEATYFIRLFAEFESVLRRFWMETLTTAPPSRTRDVVDSLGARKTVPAGLILQVHAVREYRNQLVHHGGSTLAAVSLATARSHLCRFISYLPIKW